MFLNWTSAMPQFIVTGIGLGPYLNILPLVTIGLFIWQQKMFMPPAADEQAEMQQKVMKYMMIVMGFMFYKVAAGLCLYFIASSLRGLAARTPINKQPAPPPTAAAPPTAPPRARRPATAGARAGGPPPSRPARPAAGDG